MNDTGELCAGYSGNPTYHMTDTLGFSVCEDDPFDVDKGAFKVFRDGLAFWAHPGRPYMGE